MLAWGEQLRLAVGQDAVLRRRLVDEDVVGEGHVCLRSGSWWGHAAAGGAPTGSSADQWFRERIDAELVDGGVQEAIGHGEVEDLEVGGHRLGRECHVDDGLRDVTHVDHDEHADDFGARAFQGGGEALDGRAARDRVVDEQHAAARDVCSPDWWLVDLMAAITGLADEGERLPSGQRDRRGQRHATGLGADDDVDTQFPRESRAAGPEGLQQQRIGVRALRRERHDRRAAVVPVPDTDPDESGSGGQTSGERLGLFTVRLLRVLVGWCTKDGAASPVWSRPGNTLVAALQARYLS